MVAGVLSLLVVGGSMVLWFVVVEAMNLDGGEALVVLIIILVISLVPGNSVYRMAGEDDSSDPGPVEGMHLQW